jgi:hypothetical protein
MTSISSWAISSAKPSQSESYLDDLLLHLQIQLRSGEGKNLRRKPQGKKPTARRL